MKNKVNKKAKIKTLHQLAKLLIKIGKELEKHPNINLSKLTLGYKKREKSVKIRKKIVKEVVTRLKKIENSNEIQVIETELKNLTLNELKYICKKLGFSFEKRRKSEIIDYILNATVKSRMRHKLLRNFDDFKRSKVG